MKILINAISAMAVGAMFIIPATHASATASEADNPPIASVSATEGGAGNSSASDDVSTMRTSLVDDDVCEAARDATDKPGKCEASETTTVSAAAVATDDELAADAALVASDGTRLSLAAASTTIYTKTWWQEMRGLYYINWWEKHIGRVYFDNAGHVWSTTTRAGDTGYHLCNQGGGIGYSIKVTSCSTEKRSDLSRPAISEWDRYQVHVVAKGIPIYASHSMHANAYDNGKITFP